MDKPKAPLSGRGWRGQLHIHAGKRREHTPSIAFRHLPPRKDVVNQCLEFDLYPEGADRVAGQLRGDKECPFSGVTKSGSLEEGAGKRWSEYGSFIHAVTSTIDEKKYVQVTTFVTRSSCCNVTNCHERTQNILLQCYTKRENGRE